MKNLNILKGLVNCKYNDLEGLISIDKSDSFSTLCEEYGINRDEFFMLGFGLSEFSLNGIGKSGKVSCYVLLLETQKYGHSFEDIKKNIQDVESVDVIKKSFKIPYSELGRYIKRFNFMALSGISEHIPVINIKEEEQ